jgi:general secretion pathway protein D
MTARRTSPLRRKEEYDVGSYSDRNRPLPSWPGRQTGTGLHPSCRLGADEEMTLRPEPELRRAPRATASWENRATRSRANRAIRSRASRAIRWLASRGMRAAALAVAMGMLAATAVSAEEMPFPKKRRVNETAGFLNERARPAPPAPAVVAPAVVPGTPAPAAPATVTETETETVTRTTSTAEVPEKDTIVLNFENADIREVIYSLAVAMNINYWVDPRVQGQVTVRTSGRLARADLWPIFHQLLRNNGFAAVKSGDLYSIVPAEEAKTRLVIPGSEANAEGHFVMNVVKVKHVLADQMAQTVTPFVSPGGDVIAFPRSNLVIVTDIAKNANRLAELIATFDTNTFAEMNAKIFKVEYAVLEDLAAELTSILEAYGSADSGSPAVLIPLTRLGAIAVIATDRAAVMAVEYWVSVLDVEAEEGGRRQVYVYRVENSKAVDLAAVLSEVYGEGGGSTGSRRRARSGDAAEAGLGLGGGIANAGSRSGTGSSASSRRTGSTRSGSAFDDDDSSSGASGGLGSSGRGGSSSRMGAGGSSRSSSSRGGRAGRSGSSGGGGVILGGVEGQNEIFEQEVRIVEDEITNSLVILSTPRDYETLRTVLRSLDVVPRQVLFEALIAEISLTEGDRLSFLNSLQPNTAETSGNTGDQGGSYLDLFGEELRLIGDIGTGGLLGTISAYRNGIEIYRGLIEAAANRGKAKILSRPNLMTSDNQEARLLVGQEVPILTSQSSSNVQSDSTTQILQSVQYRDTGLVIRALPQVNSEGLVNLELSLEISEVAPGESAGDIQSPTFTTRKAETSVVVHSGETLIIGGIIAESTTDNREGVPYLMDIPVLGPLFRGTDTTRRRVELIILITPFVVRDRDEARTVTEDFRRRVDGVLKDVEVLEARDPASHTLIIEAPTGPTGPPPPPVSKRAPVPAPNGGPIPLDFRDSRS